MQKPLYALIFLLALAACDGGSGGGGAITPAAPNPSGQINVAMANYQPFTSSPANPFNVDASLPFLVTVSEVGYNGSFSARVVSWTDNPGPCLQVSAATAPLAFVLSPTGLLCVLNGTDIEGVRFSDGDGNSATAYLRLI